MLPAALFLFLAVELGPTLGEPCSEAECGQATFVVPDDWEPSDRRRSLVFENGRYVKKSDASHDNSADFPHSGSGTCDLTLRLYTEPGCDVPWLFQYRMPTAPNAAVCLNMHLISDEISAVHATFHAPAGTGTWSSLNGYAQEAHDTVENHFLDDSEFNADFLELRCNSSLATVELRAARYNGLNGTAQPAVIPTQCPATLETIDRDYPTIYDNKRALDDNIASAYLAIREPLCLYSILDDTAMFTDSGESSRAAMDTNEASALALMGFVHSDTLPIDSQRPVPPQGLPANGGDKVTPTLAVVLGVVVLGVFGLA